MVRMMSEGQGAGKTGDIAAHETYAAVPQPVSLFRESGPGRF